MSCKENNLAQEIIKITKPDEENKVTFCTFQDRPAGPQPETQGGIENVSEVNNVGLQRREVGEGVL
jgi:hypothetical protein